MKYLYQQSFSVGGYGDAFAKGWEETFGKKSKEEPSVASVEACSYHVPAEGDQPDAVEIDGIRAVACGKPVLRAHLCREHLARAIEFTENRVRESEEALRHWKADLAHLMEENSS